MSTVYAPAQAGTTRGTRYLLELTPSEWAEQFAPLDFVGRVQPTI